ncbi:MAG: 3-hydroxyacyl-CoA dehydrogenase [Rhodospirillaceae bacterium]|nr:3-hydroxyacyl-CoA dehydrogenase [Rhodospirillaceae bacterium]
MAALSPDTPVAVIGAGTMGAGIAHVAAAAGHPVLLFDADPDAAKRALHAIAGHLDRAIDKGRMVENEADAVLERIAPVEALEELATAGLVIEAVIENAEIKVGLFKQLEDILEPDAIIASNTSSLSITELAASLARPPRLAGMHFFNPAPVMALVEVIQGLETDSGIAQTLVDTAAAWGKSPVLCKSSPGFIVNRIARPFNNEAIRLLDEGATDVFTLDAVMREAGGFRMGPGQLMDLVGVDLNWDVANAMHDSFFKDPRFRPSRIQAEMVAAGRHGRKTKRGWDDYPEGAETPAPQTAPQADPPSEVTAYGDLGPANALLDRLEAAGVKISRADGPEGHIHVDGHSLALTDGRMATERAAGAEGPNLALFDLALDYGAATRIAVAVADQADPSTRTAVAGLFQAAGIAVSFVDDTPALLLTRTVCLLANFATDAMMQGVTDAAGIDTAMLKGLNYPRGPLAWADTLGAARIVTVLDNLQRLYGDDRYRATPLMRRHAWSGQPFHG